jgi:hypothetical protein
MSINLKDEIELELVFIKKTVNDINGLIDLTSNRDLTIYDSAAAAMLLSQYYNGIENILKRIIKAKKLKQPTGEQSHVDLFNMFTQKKESQSDLPVLFPENIREGFVIIRRFRHFAHHGYAFNLDWELLLLGMKSVGFLYSEFRENIESYMEKQLYH